MNLFTPFSRAVLYKDGGFSSTELVKRNQRTCCLVKLKVFPTGGAGMGVHPTEKINIDYPQFFPTSVMPAHPTVPPLQTAALIDSAYPSSLQQRGRDRQSVTDSLST